MTLGNFSSDFGRSSSERFPTKWLFPAVTSPIQTVNVKLESVWPSRRRAAHESAANVLNPPNPTRDCRIFIIHKWEIDINRWQFIDWHWKSITIDERSQNFHSSISDWFPISDDWLSSISIDFHRLSVSSIVYAWLSVIILYFII